MQQLTTIHEIQVIIACFLVSICASFARVFLFKYESFRTTLFTFIGGIFFGTLAGFIISKSRYANLDVLCAAWSSLIGKEFVNFLIIQAPALLKLLMDKITNIKIGSK